MSLDRRRGPGSVLATVAGLVGLLAAVALAGWALLVEPDPPPELLEHVAFGVILAGPFAVSLLALTSASGRLRGGIWIGAGLVGVATPFGIFSFVALYFIPIYVALAVAGIRALAATREERGPLVVPVAAVVLVGALSIVLMQTLRTPACYYRAGDTWERRPFSNTISGPTMLETGEVSFQGTCGQFVTATGGGLAIGAWFAAGLGFWLAGRRRPAFAEATA